MFGPNTIGTGFSITKVLGGLSKVLGVANQAIPIYKEIKPMIGNARKVMSILKEFNNSSNTSPSKTTINVEPKKEVAPTSNATPSSNLVFFQ